jgi:hypothetical protein
MYFHERVHIPFSTPENFFLTMVHPAVAAATASGTAFAIEEKKSLLPIITTATVSPLTGGRTTTASSSVTSSSDRLRASASAATATASVAVTSFSVPPSLPTPPSTWTMIDGSRNTDNNNKSVQIIGWDSNGAITREVLEERSKNKPSNWTNFSTPPVPTTTTTQPSSRWGSAGSAILTSVYGPSSSTISSTSPSSSSSSSSSTPTLSIPSFSLPTLTTATPVLSKMNEGTARVINVRDLGSRTFTLLCELPSNVRFKVSTGKIGMQPSIGSIIGFTHSGMVGKTPRFPILLRERPDLTWQDICNTNLESSTTTSTPLFSFSPVVRLTNPLSLFG